MRLYLIYFEGFNNEETAHIMKKSKRQIENLLYRAKQALKNEFDKEVEAKNEEAKILYKNYQTEVVFLSDEMKVKKENEIVAKEKEANELKRKYFGPEGEFFKKRESLMKPIQDEDHTDDLRLLMMDVKEKYPDILPLKPNVKIE